METWTGLARRSSRLWLFVFGAMALDAGAARADGATPGRRLELAQLGAAFGSPSLVVVSPEAQALYERGARMRRAGLGLVIAGAIAMPIGLFAAVISPFLHWERPWNVDPELVVGGSIFLGLGAAMLATGIPLRSVGRARMKKAVQMGYSPTASFAPTLQLGPHGATHAGMALRIVF